MKDNLTQYSEILKEMKGEGEDVQGRKENGIFYLTLNRPSKYNSISLSMYLGIADILNRASADPEVRVIIFSGNGKNFCSGNDLTGFLKIAEKFPDFSENFQVYFPLNLLK